ncbi:MAG: CPBP family intramembrane metalloprotease [Bacteroidales bacterium]|nr:CPBP family intramembrane metalloprotease [Bacteroidales bacterium]
MTLLLDLKKRLLFLLFAFLIGYFIVSLASAFIVGRFGADSTPAMRIVAVLQDIILFILPALATALIVTRQPAELLEIDRRPPALPTLLAICVLIVAIPAMNAVIWLNQSLPLPDSLAHTLRQMEEHSEALVATLQGPHNVPNLIVSILVVGVFAGLSEELLFRGAFQRLLSTGGVNVHAAIWIVAIVFSLMHMQFYGFVPRMLLGAFFGYTLLWTRSLWVPIILHAFNNSLYVCAQWVAPQGTPSPIDTVGSGQDFLLVAFSAFLAASGLILVRRACVAETPQN